VRRSLKEVRVAARAARAARALLAAGATAAVLASVLVPVSAFGAASGGEGGGTITVGAGDGGSSGGDPGSSAGGDGASGPGAIPWQCTYEKLVLNDDGGSVGGPTPGSWYSVTCVDTQTGASTTDTEWIPDQSTTTSPPVDPRSVALEAENSLRLPAPVSHLNPASASVVNLPTWLWVDAGIWHSYSVSASVGSVSATAVATPHSVEWSMGDGGAVVCDGPGTPFDPYIASSEQSTGCSYTYARSSAGQPSPDGSPDDAIFEVRATVNWSVSWSAQGAAGGGELPSLTTSTSTAERVVQVESINELVAMAEGHGDRGSAE
jgi:hypothetical protein